MALVSVLECGKCGGKTVVSVAGEKREELLKARVSEAQYDHRQAGCTGVLKQGEPKELADAPAVKPPDKKVPAEVEDKAKPADQEAAAAPVETAVKVTRKSRE